MSDLLRSIIVAVIVDVVRNVMRDSTLRESLLRVIGGNAVVSLATVAFGPLGTLAALAMAILYVYPRDRDWRRLIDEVVSPTGARLLQAFSGHASAELAEVLSSHGVVLPPLDDIDDAFVRPEQMRGPIGLSQYKMRLMVVTDDVTIQPTSPAATIQALGDGTFLAKISSNGDFSDRDAVNILAVIAGALRSTDDAKRLIVVSNESIQTLRPLIDSLIVTGVIDGDYAAVITSDATRYAMSRCSDATTRAAALRRLDELTRRND